MSSMVQRAAAALIIGGVLTLVGYGAYSMLKAMFESEEVPLAVSIAVTAVVVGFAILLLYVAVDRIRASRSESFEEVD